MASPPGRTKTLPAPVEGWDTENALEDMPEKRAVVLDNWFPSTDKITVRPDHQSHATGMSGDVDSLLEYSNPSGTDKLFAANGSSIYDVSSSGGVPAASASGLGGVQFQSTQIGTPGGNFLFGVNGIDAPQVYDGSSFSASTITGPTITNLIWTNLHQRRLWFGEKNSLDAWYLATTSITGAASKFPLGAIAKKGGYLVAMGTWTRDAGDGADDVAVFITSNGEAIVYQGTDPSSSTTWSLVGRFDIGRPIGRRPIIKDGADLIIVTEDGLVAASAILLAGQSQAQKVAISKQINKAVNDAVRAGGSLFGWQPFLYPKGAMLVFNVPQTATTAHQYVFNTITKAPCRFTGMNGRCWGMRSGNAYFGGNDGKVYRFDTGGFSDNGANIVADVLQAFSYCGFPNQTKAFKRIEPIFQSNGDPFASIELNIDWQIKRPTANPVSSPTTSAKWGISKWGVGKWGTNDQVYRGWRGATGTGLAAAPRIRVDTTTVRPSLVATRLNFVPGGIL